MRILICGIGAIGSNLAAYLASDVRDQHEITVLDFDKIEERNVRANTQAYTPDMIGLPKVEALQYILHKIGRKIEIINRKIMDPMILPAFDLFIDCLDNHEARKIITEACKNVPCVHLGFGKYTWSILWNEEYQPPETAVEWDICELPGASSFVHMVAAVGSSVIQEFLTTGKKKEFCGNKFSIREVK